MNMKEESESVSYSFVQSCPTLCNPMDCSLPGSSVLGILQARILEWVAIPFSRGSSRPGDQTPGLLHCKHSLLSEPCRRIEFEVIFRWTIPSRQEIPWWLSGKEASCQCRRYGFDPWVTEIWRRKWQPTLVFLPGEFQGQRSLAG